MVLWTPFNYFLSFGTCKIHGTPPSWLLPSTTKHLEISKAGGVPLQFCAGEEFALLG